MRGNQMFSSDWYRRQVRNELELFRVSSGIGTMGEMPLSTLLRSGKKKNKKKKSKNGMPEGLENDSQSSENDHWNEASGEWTDEPQETFVQMTLQDLLEIDEEVPAARQQKLLEIDEGEETPQPKKRKKRGKKVRSAKQQEPQQLRTNTASQQTRKQQPEKTTASVYTKSAEELQEIMLWSEILGEPAAVRRRKRKVNQQYGNQSNAYRR